MGIVWEALHKGVPLLGVPRISLEVLLFGVKNVYKDETVGGKPILHQMFCPFCPVIGAG